tara:strand:+ start:87371 stop:87751 length:381 start_codon:yes stop_codon:yes gene_type:complete
MKKADLKSLIKPLVKECITEMLLEEGLLKNVVSQITEGLQPAPVSTPAASIAPLKTSQDEKKKIEEVRKKMLDAVGKSGYNGVNVFENTTPLPKDTSPSNPVAGVEPGDSGVDISSIVNSNWKNLI